MTPDERQAAVARLFELWKESDDAFTESFTTCRECGPVDPVRPNVVHYCPEHGDGERWRLQWLYAHGVRVVDAAGGREPPEGELESAFVCGCVYRTDGTPTYCGRHDGLHPPEQDPAYLGRPMDGDLPGWKRYALACEAEAERWRNTAMDRLETASPRAAAPERQGFICPNPNDCICDAAGAPEGSLCGQEEASVARAAAPLTEVAARDLVDKLLSADRMSRTPGYEAFAEAAEAAERHREEIVRLLAGTEPQKEAR